MIKLKRAVIKEEFVALTGDFKKAIILNQLIYWSERVEDFDFFIKEEKERNKKYDRERDFPHHEVADCFLAHGWIYKKAEELSEETMLGLNVNSMRDHIKYLVERGWVSERTNPAYKWDKTLQYRVNLVKIKNDLNLLGYNLEGYKCDIGTQEKRKSTSETLSSTSETLSGTHENRTAIPETITETTTDNIPSDKPDGLKPLPVKNPQREVSDYFCDKYFQKHGQKYVFNGAKDATCLKALVGAYGKLFVMEHIDWFFKSKDPFISQNNNIGILKWSKDMFIAQGSQIREEDAIRLRWEEIQKNSVGLI